MLGVERTEPETFKIMVGGNSVELIERALTTAGK
jgi:hypothetical protein